MNDILKIVAGCAVGAVCGGALLLLVAAVMCAGSGGGSPSSSSSGDIVVLRSGAGVMVCATSRDFRRCTQLSVARDADGLAQMERAGQLFVVSDGTSARVIDGGFSVTEVRIAEGIYEGRGGFVATEHVLPTK